MIFLQNMIINSLPILENLFGQQLTRKLGRIRPGVHNQWGEVALKRRGKSIPLANCALFLSADSLIVAKEAKIMRRSKALPDSAVYIFHDPKTQIQLWPVRPVINVCIR